MVKSTHNRFSYLRCALYVVMLGVFAGTAQAQTTCTVVGGPGDASTIGNWITDKAQFIWTQLWDQKKIGQDDFGRAMVMVNEQEGYKLQEQNTNTISKNVHDAAAQGVHVQAGENAYVPPTTTSCGNNARSQSASNSKTSGGHEAKAFTMANSNRPDDPGTNAKFINLRCIFHFAPNTDSKTDPEASAYKALNSKCDGTHAHADEVLDAVLAPLEFNVDPQLTLVNHVFVPPTIPPPDKQSYPNDYYPFYEALFFCLNVNPPQPTPPQAASGKATLGLLNIGPYVSADAANSVGPSGCFRALERRMQYGSNINPATFPAFHKDTKQNIVSRHDEQVARCNADHNSHVIDDATWTDCKQNGRSDLQADHDLAYRDGSPNNEWESKVLATLGNNAVAEQLKASAQHDELDFDKTLEIERMSVVEALQSSNSVGHSISHVSSSPTQVIPAQ